MLFLLRATLCPFVSCPLIPSTMLMQILLWNSASKGVKAVLNMRRLETDRSLTAGLQLSLFLQLWSCRLVLKWHWSRAQIDFQLDSLLIFNELGLQKLYWHWQFPQDTHRVCCFMQYVVQQRLMTVDVRSHQTLSWGSSLLSWMKTDGTD